METIESGPLVEASSNDSADGSESQVVGESAGGMVFPAPPE